MGGDISGVTGVDTVFTMDHVPTAADGIHMLQVDGLQFLWQAERAHW